MNLLKHIKAYRIRSKDHICAQTMISRGIVFLFLLSMAGCITGTSGTAGSTPAPTKPVQKASEPAQAKPKAQPPAPKRAIPILPPAQVASASPAKVSPAPAASKPTPAPTAPIKIAKKITTKEVQPAPEPAKRPEPLSFHLKQEMPEEATKPAPASSTASIVLYTLPENKKFHGLHQPIDKEVSCVSGKCHAKKVKENKYVHAPVATGACVLCHGDTNANPPYGLIRTGQNLCLSCHKDMIPILAQAKSIHQPVKKNCTGCHNPHSADSKVLLREPAKTLCITCHEKATPDFMARITKAGLVSHKPVAEGRCAECHAAHVSNFPNLLKKGPKEGDLCFSCHKEMGANIKKATFKHGPVQDGLCNACHNPHVSPNAKMLKYFYVKKFYNPFDPEVYSLCFKCHKESVVLNKRTATLTNFRNGDRNLHFLHVNREKGRTCLACHEIHAGSQERKIRLSTPFGDWTIPIKYKKSTTGGTCAASCHLEKRYDRVRPVRLEIDAEELAEAKAKTAKKE